MQTVICTLFEGNYHYGVAALINSLYKHGFRGDVFAGYRNRLPKWADRAKPNQKLCWAGSLSLTVNEGICIHFLPLETTYHLTNYKPDFMLALLEGPAKNAKGIFYFDPDIVIKCRWSFFEQWITNGIALVHEITSNDMPDSHPIRGEWKKIIHTCNLEVIRVVNSYINAGFCGVSHNNREFIYLWSKFVKVGIDGHATDPSQFMSLDRTHPFYSIDQDSLNIAALCCSSPLSEIGPEGMDFTHGGWTMSHAVGNPKPWKKQYILQAIMGKTSSLADRQFWKYANGLLIVHSQIFLKTKMLDILVGVFINRFYKKH